jgi:hypothetical protein
VDLAGENKKKTTTLHASVSKNHHYSIFFLKNYQSTGNTQKTLFLRGKQ